MLKKILCLTCSLFVLSSCQTAGDSNTGIGSWFQSKNSANAEKPHSNFMEKDSRTVRFNFESSTLSSEMETVLEELAMAWHQGHKQTLTVEGHCDERGTRDYNLGLGERRANAVKNYLISQGIPSDVIDTISYGKEKPIAIGDGEAIWLQNRRAVVLVSN